MEFRICFTCSTAKYENDMFSLYEISNEFIHAFHLSKIQIHQSGPLNGLKLFTCVRFISSMESLSKASKHLIIIRAKIEDRICNE